MCIGCVCTELEKWHPVFLFRTWMCSSRRLDKRIQSWKARQKNLGRSWPLPKISWCCRSVMWHRKPVRCPSWSPYRAKVGHQVGLELLAALRLLREQNGGQGSLIWPAWWWVPSCKTQASQYPELPQVRHNAEGMMQKDLWLPDSSPSSLP